MTLLRLQTMKRVYLDYAAATPLDKEVREAMAPFMSSAYGNPSAIHAEGVAARKAVEGARATIATVFGVLPRNIVFTSSATESASLAIVGAVDAWKKVHPGRTPHIIVSAIEHDAVLAPARALEEDGVRVTRLRVLHSGIIDIAKLEQSITLDTVVISLQYANNEVGTIQPLQAAAKTIRKWKKAHREVSRSHKPEGEQHYPLLHTDAVQAANYLDLNVPRLGVDLMTLNASKIYGPKGIALLHTQSGISIDPMIVGGGQEGGMRAGTEFVSGIVGFAKALEIASRMREQESARLTLLRDALTSALRNIPGLIINGDTKARLPNNVHFSLPDVDHEYLALLFDARGFAVATKSACNETDAEMSHVLLAMRGNENEEANEKASKKTREKTRKVTKDETNSPISGIRISMGRDTSAEDIDAFIKTLKDILAEGLLTQP